MKNNTCFHVAHCFLPLQILCQRCSCSPIPPWGHLDIWSPSRCPGIRGHCIPFYNLQRIPGDVHLHIPLCIVQEGKPPIPCGKLLRQSHEPKKAQPWSCGVNVLSEQGNCATNEGRNERGVIQLLPLKETEPFYLLTQFLCFNTNV